MLPPGRVVVMAALALAGCSTGGASRDDIVDAVAFPLYAPVLDGARPETSTVSPDVVTTTYDGLAVLVQLAAPDGDPCRALEPYRMADDTCSTRADGLVVTSMEEMSGVGLVRGETLLFWDDLVTEADPGLVERAASSLREAPEATAADLGEIAPANDAEAGDVPPHVGGR